MISTTDTAAPVVDASLSLPARRLALSLTMSDSALPAAASRLLAYSTAYHRACALLAGQPEDLVLVALALQPRCTDLDGPALLAAARDVLAHD